MSARTAARAALCAALLGAALVTLAPAARASGAWTTMLRAYRYTDLLAEGDTLWCASLEGGLLLNRPAAGTFESIVREPGSLASNRLTALAHDRTRNLWVGTEGSGASRLANDRRSWRLVNTFDGLPSDTITVLEAQGDTVWVGTPSGLALWNGRNVSGTLPDGVNPSPFQSNSISGVAVFGDTLWVATRRGVYRSRISTGLNSWTNASQGLRSLVVEDLASDGVSLLARDSLAIHVWDRPLSQWVLVAGLGAARNLSDDRGEIHGSGSLGIFRWAGTAWAALNTTLLSGGPAQSQFSATVDAEGRHWAANQTGVYREPDAAGAWTRAVPPSPPGNGIQNLDVESPRLYVNTFDEGIGRFDGTSWRSWAPAGVSRTDTSFRDVRFAYALLVDKKSRKWIANWAPLVALSPFCVPDTGQVEILDDGVNPPNVTHRAVLDSLGPARHSFAWAAALDSLGGHWFGMESPCREQTDLAPIGLDYYNDAGNYVANYRTENSGVLNGRIHALTVDRTNRVWVGYSPGGIDFFTPPAPGGPIAFTHVNASDALDVQGMVAHRDSLWVLTTSELRRYNTSGSFLASYLIPAGPSIQASVRPLAVARDGTVWCGTSVGIRVFRPGGQSEDFTVANSPLADDEVRAIRIDPVSGVVWIGTARGLNRYDPGYTPPSTEIPRLDVRLYPNPVRNTALGFGLRLAGNASSYRGAILDLGGRIVRRFSGVGDGGVVWDGRDGQGERVRPGIYFVRVEAGGRTATARIVVLH